MNRLVHLGRAATTKMILPQVRLCLQRSVWTVLSDINKVYIITDTKTFILYFLIA